MQASEDPNQNPSKQVRAQIAKYREERNFFSTLALGLASTLLHPLRTIAVSMQLSVIPNLNKYGNAEETQNALAKQNSEITRRDKAYYELQVKSNLSSNERIFQAPVYRGFVETVKGLARQGFLGFYKGLGARLAFICCTNISKARVMRIIEEEGQVKDEALRAVRILWGMTVDVLFYPLWTLQSRFILQNRKEQYRSYSNYRALLRENLFTKNLIKGALPAALLVTPLQELCLGVHDNFIVPAGVTLCWLIGQPFLTAVRRIQCQDKKPGMLPPRYAGVWHCVRLTAQEQGLRGLYRGAFLELVYRLVGLQLMLTGAEIFERAELMKLERSAQLLYKLQ